MQHEHWLVRRSEADNVGISSAENRREGFDAKQPYSVQRQDDSDHPLQPEDLDINEYTCRDNVRLLDQSQIILCVKAVDHALRSFEYEVHLHDPQAWVEQNSDSIDNIAQSIDLAYPTDIEAAFTKLISRNMIYKVSINTRCDVTTDPGSIALLALDSLYICPLKIA